MPLRGLLAVLVILSAAAAGWYFFVNGGKLDLNAPTVSRDITKAPAPVEPPQLLPGGAPRIDIVRIDAARHALFFGRAAPGAKVTALSGSVLVGSAIANPQGAWGIDVSRLAAGAQEIGIRSEGSGTGQVLLSPQSVIVEAGGSAAPLAVLQMSGEPSRVMQRPDDDLLGPLSMEVSDMDESVVLLSGRATADSSLRVYVDNEYLGAARANAGGTWKINAGKITPGAYTLRLDELAPTGGVAARIEAAFERVDPALAAKSLLQKTHFAVVATATDWRIARALTGSGYRYTVVYRAGQGQIRDPSLIYPGQIFEEPEAPAQKQ